jgi:hypothetical protein
VARANIFLINVSQPCIRLLIISALCTLIAQFPSFNGN